MITYKITIDHTKISANLINFPIMLVLSHMPDVVYPAKVQITANGVQCYAEVSAGCLWVNVPVISSTVDTIIYLDYDPTWVNNTVYIGVTGTAPAQNVWDVNFMAVLHLVEQGNGTVGEYKDSTNRKHHGTAGSGYYGIAGSGAPSRVIDELGIAVNMFAGDGVNRSSEIDIPSSPDLSIPVPGGFTVEGCLSPNSDTFTATGTEHSTPWLSKGPYDINNNVHVEYDQFINDKLHPKPNWCTFYVCSPSGGLCAGSLTTGDIPTNSWLHLVGIASCTDSAHGTNQEFRNGVPFQTSIADWATGNGGAVIQYVPGTAPVKIGCWDAANEKFWFPGRIKEVRISNIARSTAWITATYATEFDNLVSFEEIGNEMRIVAYCDETDYFNQFNTVEYNKLTHAYFMGIVAKSSTDPTLSGNFAKMASLRDMAHAAGAKCLFCLISLTWGTPTSPSYLTTLLNNATLRAQLVTNIVNFIATYNLDGIHIDWEGTDVTQSIYHAFLTQLRAAMPTGKLISVAGLPDINYFAYFNASTDAPLVDMFDIMLYDMGFPADATYNNFVTYTNMWLNAGFPASKLNCGIPLYACSTASMLTGYYRVIAQYNPATSLNQLSVSTVLGWNGNPVTVAGGVLWWNGVDLAIQKTQWALAHGIGGMMLYSVNFDAVGNSKSLLSAIYNTINPASSQIRLIGSTTDYGYNSGNYQKIDMSYYTHLIYSGVETATATDPTIVVPNASFAALTAIVNHAHSAGKKAICSFYNAFVSVHGFQQIASNPTLLAQFTANVKNIVTTYGFDGILIDDEDPGGTVSSKIAMVSSLYAALNPLGKEIGYYFDGPAGVVPYVDWLEVTFEGSGDNSENGRYNDFVAANNARIAEGWPASKLLVLFQVYAYTNPRVEIGPYSDIVAAGYDINQSQANASTINSAWYGANYPVPGGVLYWDGVNLNKRKIAYAQANGFGGYLCFASDYDVSPNSNSKSLISNVYEAFATEIYLHAGLNTLNVSMEPE
jgi:GH18 family chitinase